MRGWALAAGLVVLAAPVAAEPPGASPVTIQRSQPPTPAPYTVRVRPPIQAAGSITVQPGDSVAGIAARTGTAPREIVALNQLTPPFTLRPGTPLILPRPRAHVVQSGDTLYGVSRQHGVDMHALAQRNALSPPYAVTPGDQLILPALAQPAPIDERLAPDSAALLIAPAGLPGPPPFLPRLAVSTRPDPGPLRDPGDLGLIDPIIIAPPPPDIPPRVAPIPPPVAPAPDAPPVEGLSQILPPPPALDGPDFRRPVDGRLDQGFGPEGDGVRFATAARAPVNAIASGVIAYAGDELPGYGRLVLVKHADDWVSAYGLLGEIRVGRGARVNAGAVLGVMGDSAEERLWFELRRGARAVDPADWLPEAVARN